MTQIARYFASLGVDVDTRQLRKVDAYLKSVERKLLNFGKRLGKTTALNLNVKIHVNTNKLLTDVRAALNSAGSRTVLSINRFRIDQMALNRELRAAMARMRNLGSGLNLRINLDVAVGSGLRNQIRTIVVNAVRDAMRGGGGGGPGGGGGGGGGHVRSGFAGGMAARFLAPAAAIGMAGYGLGSLNKSNQELVSTEIAAGAIFGDRAEESKARLQEHADYVGYNYLETMPIYSSFMASSMPLMGYDKSQGTFEALAEFGRTRGTDAVGMKRAMVSLQQMASKGQVMAEELKGQLSEAKGFGESKAIFAEANQLRKGGTKTGEEAAAELIKDMENGEVLSNVMLPLVSAIYKAMASGGIEAARESSIAYQARFQNSKTEALRKFSENGGEEGFTRIWKAFAIAVEELVPSVGGMGELFNKFSKKFSGLILIPQSIQRAMDGRDSWVADKLGPEKTQKMKEMFESLGKLGDELGETFGLAVEGWQALFATFGGDIMTVIGNLALRISLEVQAMNRFIKGDFTGSKDSYRASGLVGKDGVTKEQIERVAAGDRNLYEVLELEGEIAGLEKALGARLDKGDTGSRGFDFLEKELAEANVRLMKLYDEGPRTKAPAPDFVPGDNFAQDTVRRMGYPGLANPIANSLNAIGGAGDVAFDATLGGAVKWLESYRNPRHPSANPGQNPQDALNNIQNMNKPVEGPGTEASLLEKLVNKKSPAPTVTNHFSTSVNVDAVTLRDMDVEKQGQGLVKILDNWQRERQSKNMVAFPDNSN